MATFATRSFELVDWQRAAVRAWESGASVPYTGTLEIFTGGGKSLVALACAGEAATIEPDLRIAVVVPTEALARQWVDVFRRYSNVDESDIGMMGAGGNDSLLTRRVLVCVLNTAARKLPQQAVRAQPLMLVVDECHRAGAPTFAKVLATPARFRLGLSATPDRDEIDEDGEPLEFDEQLVGKSLGGVVHRFGLRDARSIGWLPDYTVHHHGLTLLPAERQEYEQLSRRIDEAADDLRDLGGESGRARQLQVRDDEVGRAARAYVALTSSRKDLLYRAAERGRVAARIVGSALEVGERRVLLFHERVADAVELYETLSATLPKEVRLEHSKLPDGVRATALADFRTGAAPILVSVKSLIEGIDVPDADVGVSVAASSSVRQRIQSLGRVLRRRFDDLAPSKIAEMHLLYMADTVDEVIYSKEDWSDLTGGTANRYWRWPADPDAEPELQDGPPATPRPTEEAEWERLGRRAPEQPEPWEGSFTGHEYSVDTLGNVTNRFGTQIANPQGVGEMVASVRGRPGGRFRVTPTHRLVLVTRGDGEGTVFLAGQLREPFESLPEVTEVEADVDVSSLRPGDAYPGPSDKQGGTYKTRAKMGGVIERRAPGGGNEFAERSPASDPLVANADRLLDAWRTVIDRGITFHVNGRGHAWYTDSGTRRFLADVPGGFAWPSSREQDQ
jgi:superfamily II DNA or RNA helicase